MDLQRLIFTVLDELHGASEQHSCIMAAGVLLDVLRAGGVRGAYPLTVKVWVLDPQRTERLKDESLLQSPELLAQQRTDDGGIITIGGGEASDDRWPAHLVVVIPEALKGRDAVCDLTIPQASVPDWGIQLGPVLAGVREAFVDGSEGLGITMNGCRVIYKAFPEDESFRQAPVWKKTLKRQAIVSRVMRRL